ncbi:MAG: RDD family protein [Promethearchaeota archaeon]
MSLKFCPKCGNKLEPDASFCDACGADLRTRTGTVEMPSPLRTETISEQKVQPSVERGAISVEYAEFLPRLAAFIIDIIIIAIIGWIITIPFAFNLIRMWWASFLIDYAIGFVYFWLLESYNNGQTLGKAALRLRTVDENTFETTTPTKYAVNNLLKPGFFFFLLDFIVGILMNSGKPERRLRLMQNVSETVVIVSR